jgi:hypothetical protein
MQVIVDVTHIYGKMGTMKTTVEIPDSLFRQAKATAAQQGTSLKDFLTEAVRAQLRKKAAPPDSDKPWMRAFGGLRDLHRETKRLELIIQQEFEHIDEEDRR